MAELRLEGRITFSEKRGQIDVVGTKKLSQRVLVVEGLIAEDVDFAWFRHGHD